MTTTTTTTVRLNKETVEVLRRLAAETHEPMQQVLAKAVEAFRRQRLLEQANAAFASLRAEPGAWASEQVERRDWEATLGDGQVEA